MNALGFGDVEFEVHMRMQLEMSTNQSAAWKRGQAADLRITGVKEVANYKSN